MSTTPEIKALAERLAEPPVVDFKVVGSTMSATPDGATIYAEREDDTASRVRLTFDDGTRADITVHATVGQDISDETREIASALYWSWWRAREMKRPVAATQADHRVALERTRRVADLATSIIAKRDPEVGRQFRATLDAIWRDPCAGAEPSEPSHTCPVCQQYASGYGPTCAACSIESAIGTEAVPHPVDARLHTCRDPATERRRRAEAVTDGRQWIVAVSEPNAFDDDRDPPPRAPLDALARCVQEDGALEEIPALALIDELIKARAWLRERGMVLL